MTDRYAVIGNPIKHSKSPAIHQAFAQQTGQQITYERLLGDLDDFSGDVQCFFADEGRGLNVTVPFKEHAFRLADKLSTRAASAAAVNTLIRDADGKITGDNTDGVGLVTDLGCNHQFNFAAANVLLLGAGGAARGVAGPLLEQGLKQLVIANRTTSKAEALALQLEGSVIGCGFDALNEQKFDLIINATATSLTGTIPAIPETCLTPGGWVYDMMYAAEATAFVRWGQALKAGAALDGLGMLVEQAAESFYLWRGVRPDTETVIHNLKVR